MASQTPFGPGIVVETWPRSNTVEGVRERMAEFRILSLDGGGIRGAFGAAVLAELEQRLGRPLVDYFDLISGSSTGAILGCSLAAGISAADLVTFYRELGEGIFHPRPKYRARGWVRPFFPIAEWVVRSRTGSNFADFFRARYCPDALEASLTEGLGQRTMSDLTACRIVIPAVNLTQGNIHLFRTPHLYSSPHAGDLRVVDVLRAATAAPTYFPHMTLPDGNAYCDGGLWAISPGLLAIAEAMAVLRECESDMCPVATDLSSLRVLSIGTGRAMYSLKPPGGDAGILYWSRRIADVMGISQVQGVKPPLETMLGDRYFPIDFEIPDEQWALDNVAKIDDLISLGQRHAAQAFDDVAERFFEVPAMLPVSTTQRASSQETPTNGVPSRKSDG